MSIEKIMEFLTAPQLPDIVAYIFLMIAFVRQMFIQRFVKKDNNQTVLKVEDRLKALDALEQKLKDKAEEERARMENASKEMAAVAEIARNKLTEATLAAKAEREQFEAARKECERVVAAFSKSIDGVKEIIAYGFSNVDSLVKSGAANKITKQLHECAVEPVIGENYEYENIKETPAETEESKEGI